MLAIKLQSYKCKHCKLTKTACANVQALFKSNNADTLKIKNVEIQRQDTQKTNDWFLKKVGGTVNCFSANVLEKPVILARMQQNFSIQRYSTESQHGDRTASDSSLFPLVSRRGLSSNASQLIAFF